MAASSERLTNAILGKAVANKYSLADQDVKVHDFKVSMGAKLGDNFACDVKTVDVTVDVKGVRENINFIAKLLPTDKMRMEMLGKVNILTLCRFWIGKNCNQVTDIKLCGTKSFNPFKPAIMQDSLL